MEEVEVSSSSLSTRTLKLAQPGNHTLVNLEATAAAFGTFNVKARGPLVLLKAQTSIQLRAIQVRAAWEEPDL
jgi:hypothetical protein